MIHQNWTAKIELADLELLGLSTPVGAAIGGSLSTARLQVPQEVRVRDGRLEWHLESNVDFVDGKPASGMLKAFLGLASASDDAFADFARSYGVLGLCTDGLPGTSLRTSFRSSTFPPVVDGDESWHWEPLDAWRMYARQAKAVTALTVALRDGPLIDPVKPLKEWDIPLDTPRSVPAWPYGDMYTEARDEFFRTMHLRRTDALTYNLVPSMLQEQVPQFSLLEAQRLRFTYYVTRDWLWHAWLPPILIWLDGSCTLELPIGHTTGLLTPTGWPANTLFNVLAAQLAGTLCSQRHLARCELCGELHEFGRKPRTDRRILCTMCRPEARKEQKRLSARKRRANCSAAEQS